MIVRLSILNVLRTTVEAGVVILGLVALTAFLEPCYAQSPSDTAVEKLNPDPVDPAVVAHQDSIHAILARFAPKSPADSLGCFQVKAGFQIEIACAEPMVADPIAIDWGPDGRLWVVEMGDYPSGTNPSPIGRGRIRYLADRDGDGAFDVSRVFLDGLKYPTGVIAWRDGVLVACAPDIFFARDTDGDGRADSRQVLYTGFIEDNPQHQVNCLRLGLDNWIHMSNGDNGGVVTALRTGDRADIHGRDCRIKPEIGFVQATTGMSQYGCCHDEFGNWFGGRNLKPIWHCVLPDRYLRRNAMFAPPYPCVDLMQPPACAPVFPISETVPRFNEYWTLNRFTAACGIEIYRDVLFGKRFEGSCFICEPAYNLVHHGQLEPDGVTYRCVRPDDEQGSEFLASRDPWFRPVQVRTGPDGALWIVDMYRLVIEHPDYIPEELHDQLSFQAGVGKGRIYRIVPADKPLRRAVAIHELGTTGLLELVVCPNGPLRDQARQLLIQRGDMAVVEPLCRVVVSARSAIGQLNALATLDGLGAISVETLCSALNDEHPAVRRHAIRLSEPLLAGSAVLQRSVLALIDDPDPRVRLQLGFSLGEWSDSRAGDALAELALRDARDRFIVASVMSSATGHAGEILQRVVECETLTEPQVELIKNLIRLTLDAELERALAAGLNRVCRRSERGYRRWQYSVVATLLDDLTYRGSSLRELHADSSPKLKAALEATEPLFLSAREVVLDDGANVERRTAAVRLLGRSLRQQDESERLSSLLHPQTPSAIQEAAVATLAVLASDETPGMLLADWDQHAPELRRDILVTLLSRKEWALALVEAIENGTVCPNEIGATERSSLILHNSAEVRRRASKFLNVESAEQIRGVIDHYREQLNLPGDLKRGREVFVEHCASCHQIAGEGTEVGADIMSISDRSNEALLAAILDPNKSVDPRYVEYNIVTMDGRILSGIITSESGNGMTLLGSQGQKHDVLRRDVDEIRSTGQSLMPVGMEKLFKRPRDLCDLITYIQSLFQARP